MYFNFIIFLFSLLAFASLGSSIPNSRSLMVSHDALRDTIAIDTISISKEILTADSLFRAKKSAHREIYLWGDNKKPVQINPLGGIAININKIYSHFSKKGKQSRRLQRVFADEYEQDLLHETWIPYSARYSTLKGDSLFVFQTYFQPEGNWFKKATHYEKIEYIVHSFRLYRDSTEAIHERMRLPKIDFR